MQDLKGWITNWINLKWIELKDTKLWRVNTDSTISTGHLHFQGVALGHIQVFVYQISIVSFLNSFPMKFILEFWVLQALGTSEIIVAMLLGKQVPINVEAHLPAGRLTRWSPFVPIQSFK